MRISKRAEYALRALVSLARSRGSCQIQELSAREQIPIKFLEQILLALRKGGLLVSKRGVGGGYSLRVPASQISVGQVIELMDGPIAPVPCAAGNATENCTCPDPNGCVLRLFMKELRTELREILNNRTIEDMMRLSPDPGVLAFEI